MSDKSWTRPFAPAKHLHFSPLRRVQQVTDSDGNAYDILVQSEEMSCGLAASAMLIDLYWGICQQRLLFVASLEEESLADSLEFA
jgi:hypothetical protein